jgi:shikimate kinase
MGSGKSAVGQALAELWRAGLRDTDVEVERGARTGIGDLFRLFGEDHFRALERAAVARCLVEHDGVLALGGGAILDPQTRADLACYAARGGAVVFLDVSAEAAANRLGAAGSRPLLAGDPAGRWSRIMEQRRPVYQACATHQLLTDAVSPTQVARQIDQLLAGKGA